MLLIWMTARARVRFPGCPYASVILITIQVLINNDDVTVVRTVIRTQRYGKSVVIIMSTADDVR